jgi:hypothetical protein
MLLGAIQATTETGLCFRLVNGDGELHGGAAVLVGGVDRVSQYSGFVLISAITDKA